MKPFTLSLTLKIWLTMSLSILITIVFSFLLSNLFYEKLYFKNVENSLLHEGQNLASEYNGGPLTDELREKIEWYNTKTESEVFVVNNPRELSACLPYEIDYQTLIGQEDRELLLEGKAVKKVDFEERFDRKVLAVIVPLLDENRLEGIIYLYVPLAKISELTKDFSFLWLLAGILFLVVSIYIGTLLVKRLTKPLLEIKAAAKKVSDGDYSVRVSASSNDEIGQLASVFNRMSSSIQKEDERKKEFLANVSHELRTPLSYVNGYSEALLTGIVKTPEEQEKYLNLMNRESKRMNRLVGDLLDLSKLDMDDYQIIKTPLPLAQLFEEALQKYAITVKEKGLQLRFDLDPDIIIEGDEGRMEQVLQNIMDNALRYTEKGEISVSLKKHPDGCILAVKDTGIGIPEADLAHIKERFFRVNKARTRRDGGTGLGLAITDKIVRLHGGRLIFDSEYGKGTTVSIIFPVLQLDD